MSPIDNMCFRPISSFSSVELELQKSRYAQPSLMAVHGIKKLLCELYGCGIYDHVIHNYENSPASHIFPGTIKILTGSTWKTKIRLPDMDCIPVAWEFWRNEVVQHVLESEVV